LRKQKHRFFTARQDNYGITHYTLQGKAVCKKDENLVLFDFNMELLYGRHPKLLFSFDKKPPLRDQDRGAGVSFYLVFITIN